MTIYAFEVCYCRHENPYRVVSLHATIAGAYKAMRAFIVADYWEARQCRDAVRGKWLKGDRFQTVDYWRVKRWEVRD